uniref:HTH_Tnp_Tc3_2 domain-containing protein n=1 Tax=Strongyloides stercoralis TaxID=6248 RepID=A0A0K0EA88_STRER
MAQLRQPDYQVIQPIYGSRRRNRNFLNQLNTYIENNLSQHTIKRVCKSFRVRYAFPTQIIIVQNCRNSSIRRNSSRRNSNRRNSLNNGNSRRNSLAE